MGASYVIWAIHMNFPRHYFSHYPVIGIGIPPIAISSVLTSKDGMLLFGDIKKGFIWVFPKIIVPPNHPF